MKFPETQLLYRNSNYFTEMASQQQIMHMRVQLTNPPSPGTTRDATTHTAGTIDKYFTEMGSGCEAGSYLKAHRLCIMHARLERKTEVPALALLVEPLVMPLLGFDL